MLTNELTSINQYFIHAKMLANWGYAALAKKVWDESIDEMKHADIVIERILYLDGVPNLQKLNKVNVGQSVPEQFKLDLAVEKHAIGRLNEGIKLLRDLDDAGSRRLIEDLLLSEEEHADWLETQLHLIESIGEQNYLAKQIL